MGADNCATPVLQLGVVQLSTGDPTRFPIPQRRHPVALHLAFGALARLYGSSNRVDADLADRQVWDGIVERYNHGGRNHLYGVPLAAVGIPLLADTYRHVRDHLTRADHFPYVLERFTHHSVRIARSVGLLDPDSPGSRTHPHGLPSGLLDRDT